MQISVTIKEKILLAQQNEINEHYIYKYLAHQAKNKKNGAILMNVSDDELRHYGIWKTATGQELLPNQWIIFKYKLISRIFGLTFGLMLMERGEQQAQIIYDEIATEFPPAKQIHQDEEAHEKQLISLLHEEKLHYMSSIVLGINDALVELTGALAGFTLALQSHTLIALTGLITGVAASFSMGASEYLSTKHEKDKIKTPLKAGAYTFGAYFIAVIILIMPFLVLQNVLLSLAISMGSAIIIIAIFNYYISVTENDSFTKRFLEMAGISLGVAAFSFVMGYVVKTVFNIEL